MLFKRLFLSGFLTLSCPILASDDLMEKAFQVVEEQAESIKINLSEAAPSAPKSKEQGDSEKSPKSDVVASKRATSSI